jgi:hypothetical protein
MNHEPAGAPATVHSQDASKCFRIVPRNEIEKKAVAEKNQVPRNAVGMTRKKTREKRAVVKPLREYQSRRGKSNKNLQAPR